nr:Chain D, ASN-ARG-ARG-ARG-ARG-TRP-ARG-GLU-ARG-GLN-ARG [Human immunodeficiency virus 1]7JYA_E Chain E, ASN-ARG-ARG-ARG-ARG-TRP-ARG-GLU-ARG-GLN-ARG [Human immunodeficiency virus 1]7JYA_F Chain F, ASN-ARG-ARG-ARG-ARG-TRP-ARG-GLU-ARG-GLN-ARG [Human immunodeficiency virus 1]
NRRRRWRERQR